MSVEVLMPKLGLTMTEGVVDKWYKAVGDPVKDGEVVASISSEKLSYDVEAESAGELLAIYTQEGEEVPVKTPIGLIGEHGEAASAAPASDASAESVASAPAVEVTPANATPAATPANSTGRVFASPLARRLAKENNFELSAISGSGANGRVTKRDVLSFKPAPAVAATEAAATPTQTITVGGLSGLRKIIARNMRQSLASTAQLTIMAKADITELLALRKELKAKTADDLPSQVWSLNILLVKAVAKALQDHPEMNARYDGNSLQQLDFINVGVATSLADGLIVPNIKDAGSKSLAQIQQDFARITSAAKNGEAPQADLMDGTFTITNLGSAGVEYFTPILNYPEVGILGVGGFVTNLALVDEQVVPQTKLPLSLTFDHQIIDGQPAAEFLQTIRYYLENPYLLLA
ncbi:dihydrolipoamide acetyltransferase family protein [Enterococcus sp. CSURQ0835]|uniref:dihydrolipoamide acetyltransferase family protein n=1 Tax=Enterococcus sp. CSURQ0835 TaxID=2681394 RepID=UPI0013590498|nr:dihydrolipoamide acetyltransferase family protein [Enterococcus sp. CSURQ0835]